MAEYKKKYKKKYKKMTFIDRLYLPAIIRGLMHSFLHLIRIKKFTVKYPEEKLVYADRYRGLHRLKKDEHDRIKCVACLMCATACPSNCIFIEAAPSPKGYGDDREKYPASFVIDELRCIFCGYCVEACPCDAIEMTHKHPVIYASRKDFIYDREKLLNT